MKAELLTFDGATNITFDIFNESEETHGAEYALLPIHYTAQPLVKYKYSQSSYSFPDVKFWTMTNEEDLDPVRKQLEDWTKPDKVQGVPKLLKLSWGTFTLPRIYLSRFTFRVTQRRGGKPVEATGSIEFLLAPEEPKPIFAPKDEPKQTVLTEREQINQANKVKDKLTKDKKLAASLKVNPAKDVITVDKTGAVLANGKPVSTLKKVLGEDIPSGLKGLKDKK